jgi:hypothetical protein
VLSIDCFEALLSTGMALAALSALCGITREATPDKLTASLECGNAHLRPGSVPALTVDVAENPASISAALGFR